MTMRNATASLRRRPPRIAGLIGLLTALAGPVAAAPVTGLAGFDHYAGASGQSTNGVLGAVVVGAGGGDLTLAAVRFDDTSAGQGYSITGGLGLPLAPMMMLRVAGTRFIGEQDLRAWRARVGPQITLPGGRTVTLSYLHYRNHLGARSDAALAEAVIPLVARLAGRAGASYASVKDGEPVLQGSLGLGWTVVPRLELSGEAGLVNGEAGAASPAAPGGGPLGGLPLLGGDGGATTGARQTWGTLSLGVRVSWP